MSLLDTTSLSATLNAINHAHLLGQPIPDNQRLELARWLASRQGQPGSYNNLFAPTAGELRDGGLLFTGERVKSAACRHILGEEAYRALILLKVSHPEVRAALTRTTPFYDFLRSRDSGPQIRLGDAHGTFCCGKCSVSLWRVLTVGGLDKQESRLASGLKSLQAHRTNDGRWRVYPYHYTLAALIEMQIPAARTELRYAAPLCERALKHPCTNTPFAQRRTLIAKRVLELA